jgi:Domain of unknown function (DUF4397)
MRAAVSTMPVNLENAKRILLATVLTGLCWALPGCQSITPTSNFAEIRFIDASPNAPGIDIYQGTTPLIFNMGFTTVTSYAPINAGSYRFTVDTDGTTQALVSTVGGIVAGHQYTVMVSNLASSLQETVFTDQSQGAPSGQIAIRIINEATQSGPYDVYMVPSGIPLIDVIPVFSGVTFNTISGYVNVPTGSYSVEIVPSGTTLTSTSVATFSSPVIPFNAGSAHSFIILDQQIITTPGAQVLILDDYESPGSVPTV